MGSAVQSLKYQGLLSWLQQVQWISANQSTVIWELCIYMLWLRNMRYMWYTKSTVLVGRIQRGIQPQSPRYGHPNWRDRLCKYYRGGCIGPKLEHWWSDEWRGLLFTSVLVVMVHVLTFSHLNLSRRVGLMKKFLLNSSPNGRISFIVGHQIAILNLCKYCWISFNKPV